MTTFEIISVIVNSTLISAVLGQAWFYKSKKRKQNAEADMSEFDTKVAQINHFSTQLKEAYAEIDRMQGIIDRIRGELIEGGRKLAEARLELVKVQEHLAIAEYNRCDRPGCPERIPPRKDKNNHSGRIGVPEEITA